MFISVPKRCFLLIGEFEIRFVNRKIEKVCAVYELVPIPSHTLAAPCINCIFVDRQRCVGNYKCFVDSDYIAVALTNGAGTVGIVKTEQMNVGFQKGDVI